MNLRLTVDCQKPGEPYLGKRAFTLSGIPCQRWDQQLPHKHQWKDVNFSGDGSIHNASNYCRSPDGATIPWCYTLNPDIRREKCYVRSCEGDSVFIVVFNIDSN